MSLVDEVVDAFDVYENAAYSCVVEEDPDTSYCVIFSFAAKFSLSAVLIMDSVREHIFLVEGSDTTSNTTS